jgi:predicted nucleic-acid-binding protein
VTGIDTNVLVRYITQDHPQQAAKATEFIESSCTAEQPGYINHIVLCEIVWVLQRCYKTGRLEALEVIEQILRTEQFLVQDPQIVWLAVAEARKGKADFADYLSLKINSSAGCTNTVTFDSELQATAGVTYLDSGHNI